MTPEQRTILTIVYYVVTSIAVVGALAGAALSRGALFLVGTSWFQRFMMLGMLLLGGARVLILLGVLPSAIGIPAIERAFFISIGMLMDTVGIISLAIAMGFSAVRVWTISGAKGRKVPFRHYLFLSIIGRRRW